MVAVESQVHFRFLARVFFLAKSTAKSEKANDITCCYYNTKRVQRSEFNRLGKIVLLLTDLFVRRIYIIMSSSSSVKQHKSSETSARKEDENTEGANNERENNSSNVKVIPLGKKCCCNWSDCSAFRRVFTDEEDELRGGSCFVEKMLDGDHEGTKKRRKAYLINLGITEEEYNVLCHPENKTAKPLYVARHHFSESQLRFFAGGPKHNNKRRSTPQKIDEYRKHVTVIDPRASFTDDNGNVMYYHIPNFPRASVQSLVYSHSANKKTGDGDALRQQRSAARSEFLRKQKEIEQQEELEAKKESFQLMTYEQYDEERKEMQKNHVNQVQQLEEQVEKLINEKQQTERKLKSAKENIRQIRRRSSEELEKNKRKNDDNEDDGINVLHVVNTLLARYGGLSRYTLFNDEWHSNNSDAANHFYGFSTWDETKNYVTALFPNLVTTDVSAITNESLTKLKDGKESTNLPLSEFEHCLIAKIYFHAIPVRRRLAHVVGVSERQMGRIIKRWAPRWGKVGEQLSILVINEDYLQQEQPAEYAALGFEKVGALFDGKDYLVQVKRTNDKMRRSQMSSKMHAAAARDITWTTPMGLCFEHTKLFGGRISEQKLVELWGSLGCRKAPVEDWKDWAVTNRDTVLKHRQCPLELATALDNVDDSGLDIDSLVMREDNEEENEEDEEEAFVNILVIEEEREEEEESVASRATTNNRDDEREEPLESDQGEASDGAALAKCKDLLEEVLKIVNTQEAAFKAKKETEAKGKKTSFVNTAEEYENEAKKALESGPQSSPLELLLQLECHERLHRLFSGEEPKLSHCILSFYLDEMKENRWALLDWLGSDLTPESHKGKCTSPPDVPLRLNKVPPGWEILGDKGFDGTDRFFPNMNPVRTPLLLRSRTVKQYLREEIFGQEGNRSLCRLRYTSEVAYSRCTTVDSLKDIIRYNNMSLLQHMHSWGHAMINLMKPLRNPQKMDN